MAMPGSLRLKLRHSISEPETSFSDMDPLPQSPDLNLIENLGDVLQKL